MAPKMERTRNIAICEGSRSQGVSDMLSKSKNWVGTYLFVKLDEGGLIELVQLFSLMIWVLGVTQALAHISFVRQENLLHLSREGMERYLYVLSVSDLL